jgi:hypothetical protein
MHRKHIKKYIMIMFFLRRAEQLSHMMSRDSIPSFVSNLVKILSNWITWFPYDFQVQYKVGGVAALRVLNLLPNFFSSKGIESLSQTMIF